MKRYQVPPLPEDYDDARYIAADEVSWRPEAGGHTGEIATMVLTPEVVRAVAPMPVLAAGGIATGQQVAAALALGAQGAWCGSVWLTTKESDVDPLPKRKLIEGGSSDTVRTRMLSGKPARMLRSELTDAWNDPDCPGFLPMPLQGMLIHDARVRVMKFEMISECVDTLEHLHSLLDQSK